MNKEYKLFEAANEFSLMLMYLTRFTEKNPYDDESLFYAWKGYDFDVLNNLDEQGYINQGRYKNKSLYITEEGIKKAKELLKKYNIEE